MAPSLADTLPLPMCHPQLVRKLGGDHASLDGLKLHRPAAAYTSHPLWDQLSSEHCSFDEACSLLAGGAAEDLLASPAGGRQLRLKRPAGGAAAQRQSKQPRQEPLCCARCGSGSLSDPAGQQRLCSACSGALQGQPAAAGAAAQLSADGSGCAAAHAEWSARVQTAGQNPRPTSWSGLDPTDCGVYCLKLARYVAEGSGVASLPGERAVRPVRDGCRLLVHALQLCVWGLRNKPTRRTPFHPVRSTLCPSCVRRRHGCGSNVGDLGYGRQRQVRRLASRPSASGPSGHEAASSCGSLLLTLALHVARATWQPSLHTLLS